MKFPFRRKNRPIPPLTSETTTGAGHQAQQPQLNPDDRDKNDPPDSARSEDSAFGIKVLVPGEAPSIE